MRFCGNKSDIKSRQQDRRIRTVLSAKGRGGKRERERKMMMMRGKKTVKDGERKRGIKREIERERAS